MKKPPFVPFCIFLVVIALILILSRFHPKDHPVQDITLPSQYQTTIIVAADRDFSPFTFINEYGKPSGYDIELISKIAEYLHINIQLDMLYWNEAFRRFENGEADVLLSTTYETERSKKYAFTIPVYRDPYVAFGKRNIRSLDELVTNPYKIGTIEGESIIDSFFVPYNLEKTSVYYKTYTEAFQALSDDSVDFIIAPYMTGLKISESFRGIAPKGPEIINSIFCIAVNKDNQELLTKLNEAITALNRNGTMKKLSDKWFKQYINTTDILTLIKRNVSRFVIAVLCAALIFSFVWYLLANRQQQKQYLNVKQERDAVLRQASVDALTGVYRREEFMNRVHKYLQAHSNQQYVFIILDIDKFKSINDTYGHAVGDAALTRVGSMLIRSFDAQDIIGRFGGDEFVVFMRSTPKNIITRNLDILIQYLKETTELVPFSLSCSIGIFMTENSDTLVSFALEKADESLYSVKQKGGNGYAFYA